uniref:Uncharacterized protein n=1 Tax=Nelumbo nucifera TaxID=4432 RepID=A0A822ZDT5_NELNU|nr:TPA_asm: hypothetical protein HUJ06_000973 [Nelumbo nucifera]
MSDSSPSAGIISELHYLADLCIFVNMG